MMLLRQEVWAGSMEPEMIVINVRPSLLLSEHRPVAAVVRGRALLAHTTAMPGRGCHALAGGGNSFCPV